MRLGASLATFVLVAVLGACHRAEQGAPGGAGKPPPPDVGVISVKESDVTLQQKLVGRLSAFRSADVRARVAGILQRRVYEEGSDVRKDQVLFQIDPAMLQASVQQAQATLAQAQATYANAHAAADRARELAPKQYLSRSDVDNALAAERSAAAAVQAGNATVNAARINLGYATVRSPIDGRAGKQQVTEGALVGQGEATLLATVEQIDPLYVEFSMSVSELQRVQGTQRGGAPAEVDIALADGSPYPHKGVLDFSGNTVDPSTGAVALRARVPNPEKALLPGTFVSINASLGRADHVFLVPQAAVQRDAASAYVLVVGADGMVARKDIDADRSQGADWIVTKGIQAGDRVIVSGLQSAQAGSPAKATPWSPPGAASDAAPAPKG